MPISRGEEGRRNSSTRPYERRPLSHRAFDEWDKATGRGVVDACHPDAADSGRTIARQR